MQGYRIKIHTHGATIAVRSHLNKPRFYSVQSKLSVEETKRDPNDITAARDIWARIRETPFARADSTIVVDGHRAYTADLAC